MLGISTSWKSSDIEDGLELLEEFIKIDINKLEMEYRISEEAFNEIYPMLKDRFQILSIHNMFPKRGKEPLLSSLDEEERSLAIKYTIKTMEIANDLEAKRVILHLGSIEMDHKTELFKRLYDRGELRKDIIYDEIKRRESKKSKYIDAVLFSLDKILKVAISLEVYIGIENRYYYHEIPNQDEIRILFKEFKGANIGYWHDVGHANVLQNFGFLNHEELLKEFSPHLIGIHLHDSKGYNDHEAPLGKAEIDYKMIKKYTENNPVNIIEVHSKVKEENLLKSIDFLNSAGFF
jgi:sugar phosphate isomerase/epimerase